MSDSEGPGREELSDDDGDEPMDSSTIYLCASAARCAFEGSLPEITRDRLYSKFARYHATALYNNIIKKQYNKIVRNKEQLYAIVYTAIQFDDLEAIYEIGKFNKVPAYIICQAADPMSKIGDNMARFIYSSYGNSVANDDDNCFIINMKNKKVVFENSLCIVSDIRRFIPKDIWSIIANYW